MKTSRILPVHIVLVLVFSATSLFAQEHSLTVYTLPSPIGRNWKSPPKLILATYLNMIYPEQYKKRYIGHMFVELSDGEKKMYSGSSYSKDINLKQKVINEGLGLGILFADIEGRLETNEDLEFELAQRYMYGNISFLRFKISSKMYQRLKKYLAEYDERDYETIYNGQNDPRAGTDAGCSAFAVSFLEVAGFLREEWKDKWSALVRVPDKLIGDESKGKKVKPAKVLFTGRWAKAEEPHKETCFIDPNYVFRWIKEKCERQNEDEATIIRSNKAFGLEYDFTKAKIPSDPIFKTDQEKETTVIR